MSQADRKQPLAIHDRLQLSQIPNIPEVVVTQLSLRGITTLAQVRSRRLEIPNLVQQALRTTPNFAGDVTERLNELIGRGRRKSEPPLARQQTQP